MLAYQDEGDVFLLITQNAIYAHLLKHSYDGAIGKYTSETAGSLTSYRLEHDYEDPLGDPF